MRVRDRDPSEIVRTSRWVEVAAQVSYAASRVCMRPAAAAHVRSGVSKS
jgi:hypothetical protein